jgi:hypothetical protein
VASILSSSISHDFSCFLIPDTLFIFNFVQDFIFSYEKETFGAWYFTDVNAQVSAIAQIQPVS